MTKKPQATCANSNSLAAKRDSLNRLKKRTELHTSQAKAYADDCKKEIERNTELIRKLRTEISEQRIAAKTNPSNEYAMRQTLTDYHTGSSIFREKDPLVVNEQIDHKLSGLEKKLNLLRHVRIRKSQRLNNRLEEFDEKVNDVVYLELEGPMGDSRCLAIENHISANEKKIVEAVILNATYQHIRDQLALQSRMYDAIISTIYGMAEKCKEEQIKYEEMAADAKSASDEATATAYKSEVDLRNERKKNGHTLTAMKKETEEQKQEFFRIWKTIHSNLPSQEVMSIYRIMSSHGEGDKTQNELGQLTDEMELLQSVTNSLDTSDVIQRFQTQSDKKQQLEAFVADLEAKKAEFLVRLRGLDLVMSSHTFQPETAEESALRKASGDWRAACPSPTTRWSRLAVTSRVTQALARLRQLLEFLAEAFVRDGLIPRLPKHDATDTELHLTTLLDGAARGAAALMAWFDDPESEQALADASRSGMFPALQESQRRAVIRRDSEDDVTGDDADDNVPSRNVIKQKAAVYVQAMSKSGQQRRKK